MRAREAEPAQKREQNNDPERQTDVLTLNEPTGAPLCTASRDKSPKAQPCSFPSSPVNTISRFLAVAPLPSSRQYGDHQNQ